MKKFTFKKEISDVWSCTENTIIKYEKKEIGYIHGAFEEGIKKYSVHLQVNASEAALAKNPNCLWMWAKCKQTFKSENEARIWVNENREKLFNFLYKEN